ncbi:Pollen Ole e 1 allergen and extensin family protein [Abeliophyllum distichum]|uniref:Pollen Ole e 1 allergen and extensin family protein n=1 Tax=Abeliophyllum distichum TaxID=126358 RepID=A0ABD1Q6J2_9LAMI
MAPAIAEAQQGLLGDLLGLISINGTVFCTVNGNIGVNGTATPVFPNAKVQLQCGAGNVVASATTNGSGQFSIALNPLLDLLSTLLSNCNLVVKTPLSICNANLPSVGLTSSLKFVRTTLVGLLNIAEIVPASFQFLPVLN